MLDGATAEFVNMWVDSKIKTAIISDEASWRRIYGHVAAFAKVIEDSGEPRETAVGIASIGTTPAEPSKYAATDPPDPRWTIGKRGQVWRICFGDESGDYAIRGNKCLGYLTKVMARPNRSLAISEIVGDVDGKLAVESRFRAQEETDQESLTAIKNELSDVEELLAISQTDELIERKNKLLAQMLRANQGANILSGNPLRKAHHNVCTQIRKFIGDRLRADMPKLANHLSASIKLEFPHVGYYPPTGSPCWQT